MARKITLTENEINELAQKLRAQKDKLPADEAQMLEILVRRAKHELKNTETHGIDWFFSWTYEF